jgi:hypothetical protein
VSSPRSSADRSSCYPGTLRFRGFGARSSDRVRPRFVGSQARCCSSRARIPSRGHRSSTSIPSRASRLERSWNASADSVTSECVRSAELSRSPWPAKPDSASRRLRRERFPKCQCGRYQTLRKPNEGEGRRDPTGRSPGMADDRAVSELNPPRSWGVRGVDGPVRGNVKGISRCQALCQRRCQTRCQERVSKCAGEDDDHAELEEGEVGLGFVVAAGRDPAHAF